jgi:hypothetical protein
MLAAIVLLMDDHRGSISHHGRLLIWFMTGFVLGQLAGRSIPLRALTGRGIRGGLAQVGVNALVEAVRPSRLRRTRPTRPITR